MDKCDETFKLDDGCLVICDKQKGHPEPEHFDEFQQTKWGCQDGFFWTESI